MNDIRARDIIATSFTVELFCSTELIGIDVCAGASVALFQTLSASDRAGLIDNAFNLAKASHVGYDVPLKLSLYLERENHFTPWRSFDISVGYIRKMLVTGSYYGHWQVR